MLNAQVTLICVSCASSEVWCIAVNSWSTYQGMPGGTPVVAPLWLSGLRGGQFLPNHLQAGGAPHCLQQQGGQWQCVDLCEGATQRRRAPCEQPVVVLLPSLYMQGIRGLKVQGQTSSSSPFASGGELQPRAYERVWR